MVSKTTTAIKATDNVHEKAEKPKLSACEDILFKCICERLDQFVLAFAFSCVRIGNQKNICYLYTVV